MSFSQYQFPHSRRLRIAFLSLLLALGSTACSKQERSQIVSANKANDQQSVARESDRKELSSYRVIDINTAPANELETLPGIGKSLAARIVEHRDKYGPFRRPEHLIIVRGISDKRFRAIRDLIAAN